MSIHKSLRASSSMTKHRNVLTRAERIKILEDAGRWHEGQNNIMGLVKVKSIKVAAKKKVKKEAEGAAVAVAVPGAPAAPATPAAPAAAAKPGAAPAAKAAPAVKPAKK